MVVKAPHIAPPSIAICPDGNHLCCASAWASAKPGLMISNRGITRCLCQRNAQISRGSSPFGFAHTPLIWNKDHAMLPVHCFWPILWWFGVRRVRLERSGRSSPALETAAAGPWVNTVGIGPRRNSKALWGRTQRIIRAD
jgi:hypothetical protein